MTKRKPKARQKSSPRATASSLAIPFVEHLRELRQRLLIVVGSIIVWSGLAYFIQGWLVTILLKPADGQHFVYTSPIGGVNFLFQVCIYSGILVSIPLIAYQLLKYLEPLVSRNTARFAAVGSLAAGGLALAGVMFGYFVGLPSVLHFLLHQFSSGQIRPLITIQSYMSFVVLYMVGSALLFQLPLILLFINRITPLKPQQLFHYERWVILLAFILAGLMSPSPNPLNMLMLAGPVIIVYQIGIGLVALVNRPRWPARARALFASDLERQAERQQRAQTLRAIS